MREVRNGAGSPADPVFAATERDGVVRIARPGATWLSTGWDGGRVRADRAHSIHVPEGWACDDVAAYVDRRLADAGFDRDGPVLLTGVDSGHARGARCGPVEAIATAGVSNPAPLPVDPEGAPRDPDPTPTCEAGDDAGVGQGDGSGAGTVNVAVGTRRNLAPGALANLVAVAAEAKATTLLDRVGVPGTTTDAVVVASDPDGDPAEYSGSGTAVGAAARACVREAVTASLDARYGEDDPPDPATARHANPTAARAAVFDPTRDP